MSLSPEAGAFLAYQKMSEEERFKGAEELREKGFLTGWPRNAQVTPKGKDYNREVVVAEGVRAESGIVYVNTIGNIHITRNPEARLPDGERVQVIVREIKKVKKKT